MKKKILFPCTFRGHLARQKLLLEELRKHFEVFVIEFEPVGKNMAEKATFVVNYFLPKFDEIKPDLLLARADRYEILPIVMLAAYKGIKIAHIEGGDLSSVIDGRVRHAISHLSDYHFPTNEDSLARLVRMGILQDRIWDFGSLDVELAMLLEPKRLQKKKYLFVLFHPIEGEDENKLENALQHFENDYDIIRVSSNSDYGRKYGSRNFSPEDYINMMRYASCCVGNSSSFIKESSVLAVPVVLVGNRQKGRLKPHNVVDVPCESDIIKEAIGLQLKQKYEPDFVYYQEGTAKRITEKLKEILWSKH